MSNSNLVQNNSFSKKEIRLNYFLSTFLFFCITLQDFYYLKYSYAPFIVYGALFYILVNLKYINYTIHINLFFLIFIILFYNLTRIVKNPETVYNPVVHLILTIPLLIIVFNKIKIDKSYIVKILKGILIIHLIFFLYQISFWFFTGEILKLLDILNSDNLISLSKSKGLNLFSFKFPRFSGLFAEPGTYSSVTMSIAASLAILEKKTSIYGYLVCLTIVIASSTLGIILVFFYFMFFFSISFKFNKLFLLTLIILISIFFFHNLFEIHFSRIFRSANDNEFDSLSSRLLIISSYLNLKNFLFGLTIGQAMPSVEDNTSFVSSYLYGGFFLFFFYFIYYVICISKHSIKYIFLISIIFLAKLKWNYFIFWILLGLVLVEQINSKYKHKKYKS